MDPITTAIVAALAAGVTCGSTKVAQQAIVDAYAALKNLLKRKFGDQSELVKSVEGLEANPDSTARKDLLKEEVVAAKADRDSDVYKVAQDLLNKISAQPGGEQHIQQATGSYIAQADRHSTASVNVNQPKEQ
jgi:hypothetical protein